LISTSPGFGSGMATASILSGVFSLRSTAARMVFDIVVPPVPVRPVVSYAAGRTMTTL
jgi:hypothetical protein